MSYIESNPSNIEESQDFNQFSASVEDDSQETNLSSASIQDDRLWTEKSSASVVADSQDILRSSASIVDDSNEDGGSEWEPSQSLPNSQNQVFCSQIVYFFLSETHSYCSQCYGTRNKMAWTVKLLS